MKPSSKKSNSKIYPYFLLFLQPVFMSSNLIIARGGVEFVPFSIEAGGVWGPAARKFFRECLALADDDRDIDLYHWSSTRFSAVWRDTLSVLVARGRAQVSVAAAVADWPKRIRDMRYVDHEDYDGAD